MGCVAFGLFWGQKLSDASLRPYFNNVPQMFHVKQSDSMFLISEKVSNTVSQMKLFMKTEFKEENWSPTSEQLEIIVMMAECEYRHETI